MSSVSSPAALPNFISELLTERQQHVADIAVIDATLARVTAALGGSSAAKPAAIQAAPVAKARRGRKPGSKNAAKPAAAPKPAAPKAAKSGMTAHEFVLDFVSGKKNPSTQDVNKHWKASGRLGNADNTMSQLTKLKKLKRSPLANGQRGSTYSVV